MKLEIILIKNNTNSQPFVAFEYSKYYTYITQKYEIIIIIKRKKNCTRSK